MGNPGGFGNQKDNSGGGERFEGLGPFLCGLKTSL